MMYNVKVFDDLLGIVLERKTSTYPTKTILELANILVQQYESNPLNQRVKVERVK